MSEANNGGKRHYIADEQLGGVKREYIEKPSRKAVVGDYVYITEYADEPEDEVAKIDHIDEYDDFIAYNVLDSDRRFDLADWDVFTVLSPTNIVRINGKRYELADRQAEVGEKVIAVKDGGYISAGEVFNATSPWFYDNTTQFNVLIPIEGNAPKDTHDLIASLSAEVARLSRKLAEVTEQAERARYNDEVLEERIDSNAKDIRTWADDYTQNKSEVADKLEMLTDDICTLDERTQIEQIAKDLSDGLRKSNRGMGRY